MPSVNNKGEMHRLVISSLLHPSWVQFITSIFTLLFYGYTLEYSYGMKKMLLLYVLSIINGNIFSGLIDPY